MKKLWIDVETTGTDYEKDTIIELAAVYDDKVFFHEYCLPKEKPENWDYISTLTGIQWSFLEKNGVSENILYKNFLSFLNQLVDKYNKNDKLIFSGWETGFDNQFIRKLFEKNNDNYFGSYFFNINYDVRSDIANMLSSETIKPLFNYKLQTVCEYFNIDFNAHSAIEDIKATIKLYHKIIGENK